VPRQQLQEQRTLLQVGVLVVHDLGGEVVPPHERADVLAEQDQFIDGRLVAVLDRSAVPDVEPISRDLGRCADRPVPAREVGTMNASTSASV
jgi:hypothetical protein